VKLIGELPTDILPAVSWGTSFNTGNFLLID